MAPDWSTIAGPRTLSPAPSVEVHTGTARTARPTATGARRNGRPSGIAARADAPRRTRPPLPHVDRHDLHGLAFAGESVSAAVLLVKPSLQVAGGQRDLELVRLPGVAREHGMGRHSRPRAGEPALDGARETLRLAADRRARGRGTHHRAAALVALRNQGRAERREHAGVRGKHHARRAERLGQLAGVESPAPPNATSTAVRGS